MSNECLHEMKSVVVGVQQSFARDENCCCRGTTKTLRAGKHKALA